MGAHAYYSKERKTFTDAYGTKCETNEEARLAVKLLMKRLKVKVYLRFHGHRQSGMYNSNWNVRLSNNPSYGLIAHELAHAVQHQIKGLRWRDDRWHDDSHWQVMHDIIVQMREDGWIAGKLRDSLARKEERKSETLKRRLSKEATRDVQSEKIGKRRDQIARLEKKIKGLQTRLATAKRSLGALERARKKRTEDLIASLPELTDGAMASSFSVTDPVLDAPDGSEIDGFKRIGNTWHKQGEM